MKKANQVEILYWAKKRHNLNIKYVSRSLNEEGLKNFCLILQKLKTIGSIFSIKELTDEYILEHGIEYLPKSFDGKSIPLDFFFNTHFINKEGFIAVDLYHILLESWCRPTRQNYRNLKKHLKDLGFELKTFNPSYSNKESSLVLLKREYPLSLPLTLKKCMKPIKWYTKICSWMYLDQPEVTLDENPYRIKSIGDRWEAKFTKRFIDLFEASELEFLHKHYMVRGAYESVPPVLALCEMTLRDVFTPKPLKEWVREVLEHTELNKFKEESESEIGKTFLTTVCDEISGKLSKTMVKGEQSKNNEIVSGWKSIIVVCYVNDILKEYQQFL